MSNIVNFVELATNSNYFLGAGVPGVDQPGFTFYVVTSFFLLGVFISLTTYVVFLAVATLKKALTAGS
ncbi:MAG: hypothetical protein P9L97_01440 [Candidatus Tenebribacter davisii]|nr:hypothetical protein [Candidatus Tenebribacter davisii]